MQFSTYVCFLYDGNLHLLFLYLFVFNYCFQGESQLEVGEYVYPFNFVLSHGIPPTFFCKYGSIRYNAEVKIVRRRRSDVKLKSMFLVLSPINLNNLPSLSVSIVSCL